MIANKLEIARAELLNLGNQTCRNKASLQKLNTLRAAMAKKVHSIILIKLISSCDEN